MEGRIEHSRVRDAGHGFHYGVNSRQARRVVQRRQLGKRVDLGQNGLVD